MNLGRIGVWTSYRPFGVEHAGEAARLVEELGYGAWWLGGSPQVPDVRPILEATSTLAAATGILNVWINDPAETAAADAAVRRDFPGRFMLGIGIGHPEATSDYRRPLHSMRAFLDGLDAAPDPPPIDERCLAALGPKMLDLAASRTAGAHTYFVPVEHTRFARERLGPGKLIATEVACVVDTDPARAKAVAREYATLYLGLRNYTRNLLDFGFAEDDFADGGSDRLLDAIVPRGSAEQIAEVVRAHLDAGADHVCVQPLGEDGIPRTSWTALAQALL
jgi:probable F420-dependent oxidoreductase